MLGSRGIYGSDGNRLEDTWDQWASTFFDLVAKGADVRSRPILVEVVRAYERRYFKLATIISKEDGGFYSTVERLLTVHGPIVIF